MNPSPVHDRLRIVLVETRNPLNIGASARALYNFGFPHLRLVKPYAPSFREARSAVGAAGLLQQAQVYSSVADAVADCTLVVGTTAARKRELHHPLHRLEAGARLMRQHLASGPVALLFGSERRGLSNEDLSHCHWLMRIPTREGLSMNLGQAVAVCLYELVRNARSQPRNRSRLASAADVERVTALLLEALTESGYVKPRTAASTGEKLRRQLRRIQLQPEDAVLWQGMLRQILWKLRS